MKQRKPLKICKFVEASFLPAFDGASERFSQGLIALSQENVRPLAIHCHRGWSDLNLIAQQLFKTIAIPAKFYYQDPKIISAIINVYKPDLLELNDLELGLSMGLNLLRSHHVPIVYDAQFVSSELMASYVKQVAELDEVKAMEKKIGKIISGVSCFTQKDRLSLMKTMNMDPNEVEVITMGSDIEHIQYKELKKTDKVILFIGNMYFQPNQEALEFIVEQLIPKLERIFPNLIFRFVGDCPQKLKEKYQKNNVVFTGRVADINKVFVNVRLCLSPIITGGGMRTKTLTYMASGKPVLSTPAGVIGIDHQHSVGMATIGQDQFLDKTIDLLNNFEQSQLLGKKARKLVEQSYTWKIFAKRYQEFYRRALQNRKNPSNLRPIKVDKKPFWLEELIVKGRFKDNIGDDEHIFLLGQKQYQRVAISDQNLSEKISKFLNTD